ncbi:RNA polymerase II transcriptional coactivator KELP [Lactuca sativa]|uniref:RNA polymerase II transcriptional coactivator KELP n=1 Tax=Lactuca sativa TaxID=4236 RepID=UPI001C690972|nr:RNA polymerase II transcriptional coactivator KELP [Lactuca sativa]
MEFERNQGKLEETVIRILKGADLEITNELVVRREAERLLGIDLSNITSKRIVRRVVESFLLSTLPIDEVQEGTEHVEEVQVDKPPVDNQKDASDDGGGRVICKLPGMMRVSVKRFKRTKLLSIREYYQKEGKVFPSGGGITLNPKEWSTIRPSFDDIQEAITKMESMMRLEGNGMKQTSNPSRSSRLQSIVPRPLIPIATTRFTGRNYYCWKRQIELFLKQFKVYYVVTESCPEISVSPAASLEEICLAKSHA